MIVGIGVDIVEIARLATALERTPKLRERLFTEVEIGLPIASLAARFAAKEAAAKALGAPPGLAHKDAEITTAALGRPILRLKGRVDELARELGVRWWHVSLSHDGGFAIAYVVAEG